MYPDLYKKQTSIKICDFYYRKYFYQRDENEIVIGMTQFKIDCWAEADKVMKKNLFFK